MLSSPIRKIDFTSLPEFCLAPQPQGRRLHHGPNRALSTPYLTAPQQSLGLASRAAPAAPLSVGLLPVRGLTKQLESLQLTIQINTTRTGARLAPRGQLNQIFDNFKETLDACRQLLESRARYGLQQGPLFNIQWFLLVKDEVDMLRDRIAVLHSKLSLALQSLEIESRVGQTDLMVGLTSLVLGRLDLMDSRISKVLGEPPSTEPPPRLHVPQPLQEFLEFITTARYGKLTNIPMCQGVDEVVFYLDRATQWHVRRQSAQRGQAFKWANIYRAYWLLQATKASDEYREASSTLSISQLEQDLPRLGMTARRFFDKLEEVNPTIRKPRLKCRFDEMNQKIVQVHTQLARSADGDTPSSTRLLEIIKQDNNAWQEYEQWKPLQEEDDDPRRGERVATCRLRSANAATERSIQIYREEEDQEHLTIITCGPGRADRVPNTVVTRQHAGLVLGGERKSDTGRVQLWSSSRPSAGSQLPEEFRELERPKKARRTVEPRIVSPYVPVLGPLGSFSRLSLSLQRTRSSSDRSALPEQQPVRGPLPQSTPSLTRTSTITSSTSRSSNSSMGGITKRPTNLIQVDKRGNMGCILDQPDPARLVIFLPVETPIKATTKPAPSLLVIDILTQRFAKVDQHIRIDPTRCDCQQEDMFHHHHHHNNTPFPPPPQPRHPSLEPEPEPGTRLDSLPQQQHQQHQRCKKVVLQAWGGASGVTAQRTVGAWNLAAAGRYQGLGLGQGRGGKGKGEGEGEGGVGGMVRVARVKKVVLGFGGG
ncbi:predicted protein [Chaetomium globosum CBS 148.51]|uniref:Uncharacterized protein n=1 Tax=Chaetomium globosum (strain ATCC 6205 / CBS 148.51 / DSM 1962 / NBRC 6347 / NRRL 1970) TaxID=306901 RepID=Q2GNE0_CHAGB|nr:uncharacterized protein CHGG_10514 [Chaetomium globosum CBS 148.51]EAQ84110.1 predicted protein [Chaetomium globosum CBS 148.51]